MMSSSSSPVQTQSPVEGFSSPPGRRTRTVAIIKNHALDRRFDIEPRIVEAQFEVRIALLVGVTLHIAIFHFASPRWLPESYAAGLYFSLVFIDVL